MATDSQFVWNKFLLEPFEKIGVSKKWSLEIVHGYIGKNSLHFRIDNLKRKIKKGLSGQEFFWNTN